MGEPMSGNLLKAGFALTVRNRPRAKAERRLPDGARVADSAVAAVAAGGDHGGRFLARGRINDKDIG